MAPTSGRAEPPLAKVFFEEPYSFGFFQAVRLMERFHPERRPVGYFHSPGEEAVRFRSWLSLNFPPSEVMDIRRSIEEEGLSVPEMVVAFMGLTGQQGVLPAPYTELIMERVRQKDRALWEFLDGFHHRLVSLFYRAWEKYRFAIGYERDRQDPFTGYLFQLIGLGSPSLRLRQSVADSTLLYYSGWITQHPRSASCLENILRSHFGVPVAVEQFVGQWLSIDRESQTSLGLANCGLGTDAILGSRLWDQQAKFRLRFGPLTLAQLSSFLPNGSAHQPAVDLVRFLAGMEFDFDFQLLLKKEEVPSCQLGSSARNPAFLGWTTWLKTETTAEDDPQLILAAAC